MDVKDLLSGTAKQVAVTWEGHDLSVSYDPTKLTPQLEADFRTVSEQPTHAMSSIVNVLSTLIVDWDVTSEGEPLAPTAEVLTTMPVGLLAALVTRMVEDSQVNPTKSAPSDARSSFD